MAWTGFGSSATGSDGRADSRRLLLPVALLGIILMVQPLLAAGGAVDLGKPTNDVPPYLPLAAFHRVGTSLHQFGLPELLFIGTQVDGHSAAERWPVVKALEQFGTLSGLTTYTTTWCRPTGNGDRCPNSLATRVCHINNDICGIPTFDWEHARYSSRYVTFVHKDLIDRDGKLREHLVPAEMALFRKYVEIRQGGYEASVWATATNPIYSSSSGASSARNFPLVDIGGYLQAGVDVAVPGIFHSTDPSNLLLSPDAIERSLQADKAAANVAPALPTDVNAEANLITALICHADGKRPSSACNRPAIKQILRHVK